MRRMLTVTVIASALLVSLLVGLAFAGNKGGKQQQHNKVSCHNHKNNSLVTVSALDCNNIATQLGLIVIIDGTHYHLI